MSMNGRKQECRCGHDRASHYWDPVAVVKNGVRMHASGDCLAQGCHCRCYEAPGTEEEEAVRRRAEIRAAFVGRGMR